METRTQRYHPPGSSLGHVKPSNACLARVVHAHWLTSLLCTAVRPGENAFGAPPYNALSALPPNESGALPCNALGGPPPNESGALPCNALSALLRNESGALPRNASGTLPCNALGGPPPNESGALPCNANAALQCVARQMMAPRWAVHAHRPKHRYATVHRAMLQHRLVPAPVGLTRGIYQPALHH